MPRSNLSLLGFCLIVAVLVVFVGMQVAGLLSQSKPSPKVTTKLARQLGGDLDDTTETDLFNASFDGKLSFIEPGEKDNAPNTKYLASALKSAQDLVTGLGISPGTARRVIILRLLMRKPAFAPVSKGGPNLADAFTTGLPDGTNAKARKAYLAELGAWSIADSQTKVPPQTLTVLVAAIEHEPTIGWWKYPGEMALYESQGESKLADQAYQQAQTSALVTVLPVLFGGVAALGMVLLGVLVLILIAIRPRNTETVPPNDRPLNVWPTIPSPIADSERVLSANLLWGIFCLYLFMQPFMGFLLTGDDGITHRKWFGFSGFLTSSLPALHRADPGRQIFFVVVLESAVYLLGAFIPMGVFFWIARRKKASLAKELNFHVRRLPLNLAFGMLGYCVALPVILVARLISGVLFHNAPDPSNPAIDLLTNSSSAAAQIVLVLLATVAAPFCEEFFFRGVFYQGARRLFGPGVAIVLTGCIFGLAHPVGISGMFVIAVLGCVLAWIAESRKSLASSMIGHCMQNVFASLVVLLVVAR